MDQRGRIDVLAQMPLALPKVSSGNEHAVDLAFCVQWPGLAHGHLPLVFIEPGESRDHKIGQNSGYVRMVGAMLQDVGAPVSLVTLGGDFITAPRFTGSEGDVKLTVSGFIALSESQAAKLGARPRDGSTFARVDLCDVNVHGLEEYCQAHAKFAVGAWTFVDVAAARLLRGERVTMLGRNVAVDETWTYVYKSFRSESVRRPNLALWKLYSPNVLLGTFVVPSAASKPTSELSAGGANDHGSGVAVAVAVFRYIKPTTRLTVGHLCALLRAVAALAKDKVVHGDIRAANVVFTDDTPAAVLIDFDFAASEGSRGALYPPRYNREPTCNGKQDGWRHPDAGGDGQMLCVHDAYATIALVRHLAPASIGVGGRDSLIALEQRAQSLGAEATDLLHQAETALQPFAHEAVASAVAAPEGSGSPPPESPGGVRTRSQGAGR